MLRCIWVHTSERQCLGMELECFCCTGAFHLQQSCTKVMQSPLSAQEPPAPAQDKIWLAIQDAAPARVQKLIANVPDRAFRARPVDEVTPLLAAAMRHGDDEAMDWRLAQIMHLLADAYDHVSVLHQDMDGQDAIERLFRHGWENCRYRVYVILRLLQREREREPL
jgi:hypothetical protein